MHQPGTLVDSSAVAPGPVPVGRQHQPPLVAGPRPPLGVDQYDQGEQDWGDQDQGRTGPGRAAWPGSRQELKVRLGGKYPLKSRAR
jgi:hypothetical protein